MNRQINQISLYDAVQFIVDNRGKTAPTAEIGIALIATNCVSNENLYPEKINVRYVSQETYDNWFRAHPIPGDILLTNKGSQNGAVCLVPDPVDFCIAQDMVALRADKNKIDPLYLFAALRSNLIQKRIKELNVDAVFRILKKQILISYLFHCQIGNNKNMQVNFILNYQAKFISIKESTRPSNKSPRPFSNPGLWTSPERSDYRQVILNDRLLNAVTQINSHIPQTTLEEAVHILTKPEHPALIRNNDAFHRLLIDGVKVEFNDGNEKKSDHVQLMDFNNPDNNQFLAIVEGKNRKGGQYGNKYGSFSR